MMRRLGIGAGVGLALVLLAACGGGSDRNSSNESYGDTDMAPSAPMMSKMVATEMDGAFAASEPAPTGAEPSPEPGGEQYIAYRHNLGLTLPKGQVEPMMKVHTRACQAAGTTVCIVVNSNISSSEEGYHYGRLSIRATPVWIEGFLGGIDEDASKAGGEITNRSKQSEDLTRQIIDTGARLSAQETLQGRLQGLLERRDGDLGDLLQIERELARVTGSVESIKAQLKTLRLRVSMSSLDLNYQTKSATGGVRDNPLGDAFGNFFKNLGEAVASVINAFAFGLPWMLLLGALMWIWLKLIWPWVRGRKKRETTGN